MSKNHRWVPPDDHVIVLFGATGDLARRKLLPGLFHLHAPPAAFTSMVATLGDSGLAEGATRLIIEKPFGTDLASARELDKALHAVFDESQVFRIDHFLGKESVDNILAFRFANGLF